LETTHFVAKGSALCGAREARWCTILREAVTCAECRYRLAVRERLRDDDPRESPALTPVP
jgi:hypothetical protein